MKKICILIVLIVLYHNAFSDIWYISEGGRGNQDGTSWSNAASDFPDLFQNPFLAPGNTQGSIQPKVKDTIFVSKGSYSPILLWHDDITYTNSFENEIHIYGGFEGWEKSLSDRLNWFDNSTIIDAKNLTKCIWVESYKDSINQYVKHVVIDGFTLVNGCGQGGAIRVVNETPLFSNLIIKENTGFPVLYFENARDTFDRYLGNTIFYNCIIRDNSIVNPPYNMLYSSSLISAIQSDVRFTNNTMVGNESQLDYSTFFTLAHNSTVWVDNSIIYFNGIFSEDFYTNGNIIYRYSNIEKSDGSNLWSGFWRGTDGGGNIDIDPKFKDYNSRDLHLDLYSPCVDVGNFSWRYNIVLAYAYTNFNYYHNYDIEGFNRVMGDNIDMGAFEYQSDTYYAPGMERVVGADMKSVLYDKILVYDLSGKFITIVYNIDDVSSLSLKEGYYVLSYVLNNKIVYSNKFFVKL